jgi:aminocarboxymuconate-semialdehyde decarboxylase
VTSILMGRLDRAWDITPKLQEALPQKPGAYAKRFFYDTIVFDPANLRHIVQAFGTSQILAGSDYPFAMGDPDPVKFVRGSGLGAGVLQAVLKDNAERFLAL